MRPIYFDLVVHLAVHVHGDGVITPGETKDKIGGIKIQCDPTLLALLGGLMVIGGFPLAAR